MSDAAPATTFALAAAASLGASWLLVVRLERVGERLGLSEALLGMVAALAADAPEITTAVTAVVHHQRSVGAGVVMGSNVFNLAALLGLGAAVAGRIDLHRKVVVLGGAVALWMAGITVLSVTRAMTPVVGLVLAATALALYLAVLGAKRWPLPTRLLATSPVRWLRTAVDEEEMELVVAIRPVRGNARDVGLAAAATAGVVVASVVMERSASTLGSRHDIPGIVLGGLLLAVVTSLPNAVAAVYLAARGRGAAALSTALNSNTINVVAGLLLPGAILGIGASTAPVVLVAAWYGGLTTLTLVLAHARRGLGRGTGAVILAAYVAFVAALLAVA